MKAHYLQHVPFEGLGSIEPWLVKNGWEISCTRFFAPEHPPLPEEFDFLIVMGGPMSVNNESAYPWLIDEKRFIKSAVDSGIPVLGICLGAQLIVSALGKKVFPQEYKEIGWLPIKALNHTTDSVLQFAGEPLVFHWHGETFELPETAMRIAESEGCPNQAFQIGNKVVGLQFHLETTQESMLDIIANCRSELVPSKYVQTEEELLATDPEHFSSINSLMEKLLVNLTEKVR